MVPDGRPDARPAIWALHAGRAGLASLFVLGGINKVANYGPTAADMAAVGLQPVAILLPATIALELGLGLVLALGLRWAWAAGLVLAVFTLATNAYFHRFWTLEGDMARLELSLFFKNVAIAGALVFAAMVTLTRRA
ncbi:MAG: DoxX family protein [Pseudomonadota bacterium]